MNDDQQHSPLPSSLSLPLSSDVFSTFSTGKQKQGTKSAMLRAGNGATGQNEPRIVHPRGDQTCPKSGTGSEFSPSLTRFLLLFPKIIHYIAGWNIHLSLSPSLFCSLGLSWLPNTLWIKQFRYIPNKKRRSIFILPFIDTLRLGG